MIRKLVILAAGIALAIGVVGSVTASVAGPNTTYLAADKSAFANGGAVTVVSDSVGANTFVVQAQVLTDSSQIECGIFDASGVLATGVASANGEGPTNVSIPAVTVTETAPTTISVKCYDSDARHDRTIYASTAGTLASESAPALAHATYLTVFK